MADPADTGAIDVGAAAAAGGEGEGAGAGTTGGEGFNFSQPLPENLPEDFATLKGKTFQDMFDSHKSLRGKVTEQGNQISELQAQVTTHKAAADEAGKKPPADDAAVAAAQQVQTEEFYQVKQQFMETGEVNEDFLELAVTQGVRPDRDTMLRFFEFLRFDETNMANTLSAHTSGKVTPEQVQQAQTWLKSGKSPFSDQERAGFDGMYRRDNYGWFDTVWAEFETAFGAEGYQPAGRFGGKMVRGKPIQTPTDQTFKGTADFQQQLLNVRNDPELSTAQKTIKERELTKKRAQQLGEA